MIPVYEPIIQPYIHHAIEALSSGWVSNYGKYIGLAETKLIEIQKTSFCILMSNGTVATDCLFYALKRKHPECSDVYLADNTFVSPYNCALRHFAPENIHILPINNKTLNVEMQSILDCKPNSCLLVVHSMSNIVNVEEIHRLRPDLIILEDNCEGFLGKYEDKPTGSSKHTLCSSISFYANKNITSGEGGAFLTNDEEIYKYICKVYSHGMTSTRYVHDVEAWNFRMTNVQAALLYGQLCDVEQVIHKKQSIFKRYDSLVSSLNNPNIESITMTSGSESSNWMYCLFLTTDKTYEDIESQCKKDGIEIRPMFYSVSHHAHLKAVDCSHLSHQVPISKKVIIVPSGPTLTLEQQTQILKVIANAI